MNIPGVVIFAAIIAILLAVRLMSRLSKDLTALRERATEEGKEAHAKIATLEKAAEGFETQRRQLQKLNDDLNTILTDKSKAMPWLAKMVADANWLRDERDISYLKTKKHPAVNAAEVVRLHAEEKRDLRFQKRLADYKLALYEGLFPWLQDIAFADAEDLAERRIRNEERTDDPAAAWLSKDEWASLPTAERYQRALDRYKRRKKNNWEIGREFERFIGYRWESRGYDVIYYGAIKGFEDFGRDLIVTGKTGKVALIQCKYWAAHKIVPEAAVFQLLGSTVSFYIERTGKVPSDLQSLMQNVQPYLYTSATLDPRIHEIATAMGIKVRDQVVMPDWPMVKCNVAADGELIYHLPMDQLYDRVKIYKQRERYVSTVAEAEGLGFRRAKRWFGNETA